MAVPTINERAEMAEKSAATMKMRLKAAAAASEPASEAALREKQSSGQQSSPPGRSSPTASKSALRAGEAAPRAGEAALREAAETLGVTNAFAIADGRESPRRFHGRRRFRRRYNSRDDTGFGP
jgi:hypothetical protein